MTDSEPGNHHLQRLWQSRLTNRSRHIHDPALDHTRRAAVTITVQEQRGQLQFLIIKRVGRGSNPGQWALPGGRMDPHETICQTALRELREETGLSASASDVLGMLDDFKTSRGIVITPFVVWVNPGQQARRNPAEVASLHPLSLDTLTKPGVPRWKPRPGGKDLIQLPLRHDMVIHAPTGAILWQFAEIVLRGREKPVSDLSEPDFTSR